MILRDYQDAADKQIDASWAAGATNTLCVMPTGAGKTVLFSHQLNKHRGYSLAVAHRKELVSQISLSLAECGLPHNIVAPKATIQWIVRLHFKLFGRSFFNQNAFCTVAGVDTLWARREALRPVLDRVTLWVQDEAHHVLRENKWGKVIDLMPNAKGLGVTATPLRADGKGLGRQFDGWFDDLVEGPGMRELINRGYLSDYRIFSPGSDIDISGVAMSGSTGDFNATQLRKASHRSHIVGDVVEHYIKHAAGKLGITFVVDVETAMDVANKFREAGVPAEAVSAKTPGDVRVEIMDRFKNREIHQLVNVDLFGEGVDVPAIEVVSMARHTASYGLYCQQFGRALRILKGKDKAIIIDHVDNVERHKLPDRKRVWSLERREKSGKRKTADDLIPVTTCPQCTSIYEQLHKACPYCGYLPVVGPRSGPKEVAGDLTELSPEVLEAMRGKIDEVNADAMAVRGALEKAGMPAIAAGHVQKSHVARQEAQKELLSALGDWGGWRTSVGDQHHERLRRFYFKFGMDVMTAQTLNAADAKELTAAIRSVTPIRVEERVA